MSTSVAMTRLVAKSQDRTVGLQATLTGIIPPVAVPFDARGEIVYSALREQVDLMVDRGVRGVVVGSTGEGYTLDRDEFARVMAESYAAVAGRLLPIAGLIRRLPE